MHERWLLRHGPGPGRYVYRTAKGERASPGRARAIDALAIPPGWRDVHVAVSGRAAIQAWGFDSRGRKQYRYHPRATQRGELRKYYRVRQLGRDLPVIRRRLDADFATPGLGRERVLAGVVRLLSRGFFRVGSERYARENHTFGITTMLKRHVSVRGDTVVFDYVGKRGIRHRRVVVSAELARFVAEEMRAPGRRLFRYWIGDGAWADVTAMQLNEYLRRIGSFPYSAKDFRTWGGTLLAATVLAELGPARGESEARRNVATAMRLVAAELGNTPAICRKSYVHPAVLERYVSDGATIATGSRRRETRARRHDPCAHTPEERELMAFLDRYFPERRRRPRERGTTRR